MRDEFERTLADIADIEGWLRPEQARALWSAASKVRGPGRIVEIGSYRGRSTVVLARAIHPDVEFVAIDPHAGNDRGPGQWDGEAEEGGADQRSFRANLDRTGVAERIRYVRARSQDALDDVTGPIDLLYIDGAHRYRVVVGDLAGWGSRVRPGGTLMIHDAFNSVGVTSALMRRMLLSPEFRYVRRCQSLAEYRREPVGGIAQLRNVARQLAVFPWFLRNVAIRTLNAVGLGGVTRLLGYQGDGTY